MCMGFISSFPLVLIQMLSSRRLTFRRCPWSRESSSYSPISFATSARIPSTTKPSSRKWKVETIFLDAIVDRLPEIRAAFGSQRPPALPLKTTSLSTTCNSSAWILLSRSSTWPRVSSWVYFYHVVCDFTDSLPVPFMRSFSYIYQMTKFRFQRFVPLSWPREPFRQWIHFNRNSDWTLSNSWRQTTSSTTNKCWSPP